MNERVTRLREIIAAENLDAFLVTQPENRRYLSGFTGSAVPHRKTATRPPNAMSQKAPWVASLIHCEANRGSRTPARYDVYMSPGGRT